MGNWIAVYAAVIATFALSWEVFRWWKQREPSVKLDVSRAQVFGPPMDESGKAHRLDLLVIELRNLDSTRRVNVTDVGYVLEKADGSVVFRTIATSYDGATLPGVVEPNDSGVTTRTLLHDGNGNLKELFDAGARVYAWAWTSTGREPLESARYRFDEVPDRAPHRDFPHPPLPWEISPEEQQRVAEILAELQERLESVDKDDLADD